MMIVKTAVCVGNGIWLPQVSCGGDDCTVGTDSEETDSEGTYAAKYNNLYAIENSSCSFYSHYYRVLMC